MKSVERKVSELILGRRLLALAGDSGRRASCQSLFKLSAFIHDDVSYATLGLSDRERNVNCFAMIQPDSPVTSGLLWPVWQSMQAEGYVQSQIWASRAMTSSNQIDGPEQTVRDQHLQRLQRSSSRSLPANHL